MSQTHTLDATPDTVRFGAFDASFAPVLTVASGDRFVELLVGQVSSPVRWDATMSSFADAGVTGIVELAPAGALTGLAKRALRGVPSVAVKTPDDLQAAVDLLEGAE